MSPWVQLGIALVEGVVKVVQATRKRVVEPITRIRSRKAENDAFAAQVRADAEKGKP